MALTPNIVTAAAYDRFDVRSMDQAKNESFDVLNLKLDC